MTIIQDALPIDVHQLDRSAIRDANRGMCTRSNGCREEWVDTLSWLQNDTWLRYPDVKAEWSRRRDAEHSRR